MTKSKFWSARIALSLLVCSLLVVGLTATISSVQAASLNVETDPNKNLPSTPQPYIPPNFTPSPTTKPLLQCLSISMDIVQPKLNSAVRFTCAKVAKPTLPVGLSAPANTIMTYNFQYRIEGGTWNKLAAANLGSNISAPLNIKINGLYEVRCQPCFGTLCAAWEGEGQPLITPAPTAPAVGTKDKYGCIPSAGYTWCAAQGRCLLFSEGPCSVATSPETTPIPNAPIATTGPKVK